jgi:DnaK suppressor protein
MAGRIDNEEIEQELRRRLGELDAEIAQLTKPPENAGSISFGKRVGEGTSQAIDRFAEVGVAHELQPIKERLTRALSKLEEGTYGVCDNCGEPIAPRRLRAAPESALCIDCARESR